MAAVNPDQLTIGSDGAASSSPKVQAVPQPGRYEIDSSCSAVTFTTRHLFGLALVRGSFAIRTGTIRVTEPLAFSSVYAEIDPASFRTRNGQRDSNVHSARLLDVGRYPVITFIAEGMNGLALSGTLTVRNVSMPVSLSIEQSAVTPRSFNVRATTRIDRTEFGLTAYHGLAGRYLDMTAEVTCVRT
jgi:polyisoprenoid-binding protein YceI